MASLWNRLELKGLCAGSIWAEVSPDSFLLRSVKLYLTKLFKSTQRSLYRVNIMKHSALLSVGNFKTYIRGEALVVQPSMDFMGLQKSAGLSR